MRNMKKNSEGHYWNAREKIYHQLAQLPRGTIKERLISGRVYFYLQRREGKKVVHAYIGKAIPKDLKKKMFEREALRARLNKIQGILMKILAEKIRDIRK